MSEQLITVSRMKAFHACRRLHHYKYELGYRSAFHAEPLSFGTLMHAGLEAWWRAVQVGREDALTAALEALGAFVADDLDEAARARAELLMLGYHVRWFEESQQYEVLDVEREFRASLQHDDGHVLRGMKLAGKIDVIVRRRDNGLVWIVEHKTSSSDLTLGSTYWQQLRMDPQVSAYFRGARALGYDVAGCIYDVIRKPQQRQLRATPEESKKYTKDGNLYANQRADDETLDEYKARMAAIIAEDPATWFGRAEVVRLDSELEESERDTLETALAIRSSVNTRNCSRARNPDACFRFNRTCEFFDVCSGTASVDDEARFTKLETVHPELSGITE